MKKAAIILFNIACIISFLVGTAHFFAPYAFQWFSYIPNAPVEIYQSINYVNFCFSFLLAGISLLLLLVQRKLFEGGKELKVFYVFFVAVWLSRFAIQLIWPWPSSLQTWLLVGFTTEFVFTLLPLLYLSSPGASNYKYYLAY
ncbi:MAG: hypothetical protein ACOX2G_11120 [Bacillota bacterium]|jgi:hypothetical protein